MIVLMVINRVGRESPSVLADCYCLTAFGYCKMKKKLNQDLSLKLKLNTGLGLRQWPTLDKNVKHRYDVRVSGPCGEKISFSRPVFGDFEVILDRYCLFFNFNQSLNSFRHIPLSDSDGICLSTQLIIITPIHYFR